MFLKNRKGAAALILTSALLLGGCSQIQSMAVDAGLTRNPYYEPGDTNWDHGGVEEYHFNALRSDLNAIYRELYSRISNQEDKADLITHVSQEDFKEAYYAVLADHPEFFWVGAELQMASRMISDDVVGYELSTNTAPEERDAVRAQLEAAADACIAAIPEGASDYEKIKAVYEYIIDTTEYDTESPNNQNIQSVLLGHASVCAGYAKTFQYILHRMGMFCTSVRGTTRNGGEHEWNIVRIDGLYYNVDTTWGDPVFVDTVEEDQTESAPGKMNYNYLCCTDAELMRTHTPDPALLLPGCTDDSYNYYKLNGLYHETYSYDEVYQALMNSVYNGQDSCVMKFRSQEAYEQAKTEIFDGGMIREATNYLILQSGVSSWSYSYQNDDDFRLITIYWR